MEKLIKQYRLGIIVLSFILLSGCVAAFMAGAAAGGLVVSDQRDAQTISDDSFIRHRIEVRVVKDPAFKNSHIIISSFNRIVLLAGETPAASLKVTAEKIAQSTPDVKRVYNEITIEPPVSLAVQSKDTWITSAVKTEMLAKPGLHSGSIKVITENGTVFLMGLVSRSQAEMAVDVARRVDGVRRVVKVFEYLQ